MIWILAKKNGAWRQVHAIDGDPGREHEQVTRASGLKITEATARKKADRSEPNQRFFAALLLARGRGRSWFWIDLTARLAFGGHEVEPAGLGRRQRIAGCGLSINCRFETSTEARSCSRQTPPRPPQCRSPAHAARGRHREPHHQHGRRWLSRVPNPVAGGGRSQTKSAISQSDAASVGRALTADERKRLCAAAASSPEWEHVRRDRRRQHVDAAGRGEAPSPL
jgi:hypothetical protein